MLPQATLPPHTYVNSNGLFMDAHGPEASAGMSQFGSYPISIPLRHWTDHFLEASRNGTFAESGITQGIFVPHLSPDRVYFQPVPEAPGEFSDPLADRAPARLDGRFAGARLFAKRFSEDSIISGWRFWVLSADDKTWLTLHAVNVSGYIERGMAVFPLVHHSMPGYVDFAEGICDHFGWGDDR